MIDEKELAAFIQGKIRYWDDKAAEYNEAGKIVNMSLCDSKAMELRTVVNKLQNMTGDVEKNSKKEKLKKIADHYGLQAQKGILIEEMAELMQAVNKHDRCPFNLDAIIEEIADVEIMLEQIKYLYGISQQKIDEITDYKIQCTLERMNDE